MKLYIAGPMTGIPDWNYPAFFQAEAELRALGHQVLNPATNDGDTLEEALAAAGSPERPNHPWAYYMKRDLPQVMDVDALVVLPGWQDSKGARLEVHVATAIGLPLLILRNGRLKPRVRAIGLSGYARSGKDTAGDFLVKAHGYEKAAFANQIREALYRLNPDVDVDDYQGVPLRSAVDNFGWEMLKSTSKRVRPLMQRFGTEVGRDMFGDSFWVDQAMRQIPDGAKVVFTDVRFPNEAEAIRAIGGEIWRIDRPGISAANAHPSEHALDKYEFDARITNDNSLSHLYKQVEFALAAPKVVNA
jgi:hypothetical protein